MKPLAFAADVDGNPKPVQMRFGNESDLAELRRWRSPARLRANPHVSDAIEYARLASKRWAYYHRNGETAAMRTIRRDTGTFCLSPVAGVRWIKTPCGFYCSSGRNRPRWREE